MAKSNRTQTNGQSDAAAIRERQEWRQEISEQMASAPEQPGAAAEPVEQPSVEQPEREVPRRITEPFVSHEDDPMLSFSEAGAIVGRSHTTIRRWVEEGLLRALRDPSGLSRIRRSELTRFYGATALAQSRPLTGEAI